MGLVTSESVFLSLLSKTSHSQSLAIEISAWLLSSFLHAAPEWTWLLLATPTNILEFLLLVLPKVECDFGWFSRGEMESAELCNHVCPQNSFGEQCYFHGFTFPWRAESIKGPRRPSHCFSSCSREFRILGHFFLAWGNGCMISLSHFQSPTKNWEGPGPDLYLHFHPLRGVSDG